MANAFTEHARKGEDVKIKERMVHVSKFEIIKKVEMPKVHVRIVCSKGTYPFVSTNV